MILDKLFKKEVKKYCIKAKKLSVSYGKKEVLKDINFTIDKKDIFGVIGLSGSGKSTLLKALMNFVHYKGSVDKMKGKVGYCPQEEAFFDDLTIKENVLLFGNLNSTPIDESIKRAEKLMERLEINEPLDKPAGELSGGQKKRLNIILSIINDPQIVILDEPFAGLDYMTRLLLWDFITHLRRQKKTIIFTTHLLNEAQKYCSNVLIISKGERFAMGSVSDLKRSLNFKLLVNVKFKYLSQDNQDKIKDYCEKRDLLVLGLNTDSGAFGVPGKNRMDNLVSMIKRLDTPFDVVEYRAPSLNEIFMVSVK
ncbi:ATP-binding cassette domain-containing protein [archaeon]|nr:ATP-binding cassette domain-containing protein [archaeon]